MINIQGIAARFTPRLSEDTALVVATSRCPHCDCTGPVGAVFGLRTMRGQRRTQSWCKRCRSSARHLAA